MKNYNAIGYYHFSNCFIEAIINKIKNPKNVHITYIPAQYNTCKMPHFMWTDGKSDYDFGNSKNDMKWYQCILFLGITREYYLGSNEDYIKYKKEKMLKENKNEKL